MLPVVEVIDPEMPLQWDFHDLADRLGRTLQDAEDAFRIEQAVYGIDSLDELRLHQLLVRGLSRWYTVQREAYYPSATGKRKASRPRCDLVITPLGRPLRSSEGPDLFTRPDECMPEEALWLEVKVAYQFRDVATRHGGYGSQWKNAIVDDLRKMQADARIREAGLLLIVFNESEEVLAKDLELFEDHLATQGAGSPGGMASVTAGFRHVRSVRITERMGHRVATAAVWPTIQRGSAG